MRFLGLMLLVLLALCAGCGRRSADAQRSHAEALRVYDAERAELSRMQAARDELVAQSEKQLSAVRATRNFMYTFQAQLGPPPSEVEKERVKAEAELRDARFEKLTKMYQTQCAEMDRAIAEQRQRVDAAREVKNKLAPR
jgi:hypothetical protein